MIRRRTITSYVWNSVSGNKMVILSNCIRNFFRKFELNGNSTQGENPAPDNPKEIKSAGRKSKNLFDINYFKDKSNLKMLQCEGFTLLGIICNVKPNTKYTLSANLTEAQYNLNIANKTQRFSLTSSSARTLMSNDDGTLYIGLFNTTTADAVNMDDFMQQYKNIQLEEGNTATYYEAYSDKYLLDVKVTGKNLLNLQKEPDVKGTYLGWKVADGRNITLSVKDKGNNADITGCYLGLSRTGSSGAIGVVWVVNNGTVNTKEVTSTCQYVSVYPPNKTIVQKLLDRFDIQLELGNNATNYEPYTEQTVQIALDEPLRGIGEYNDTITKDGVVRKIKRIVFDGSEDEKWGIGIERENVIDFVSTQFSDATKINEHQRSMMDKLKWSSGVWGRDEIGQDMFAGILRINMPKTLTPDLQTFRTWLSQNPLTVDYVLAEPVTEPLPESVQAQLTALHSENGVTHVFVDSGEVPCGINIEYKYKS